MEGNTFEHLSNKLTNYILEKKIIRDEDYAIYQYGFQCFLELSISTLCSVILALALHMVWECLLFFLFFIPMRSFGGGIHLNSYFACLCSSCLILLSTLLAVKYLTVPCFVSFAIYFVCVIFLTLIGPVNHPNREIISEENRIFMERTNRVLWISLLIASLFLVMNHTRYLFLEAVVFLFLCITSFLGKIKYCK